MPTPLILPFAHPAATDPALTGGKGASLARLAAGGFEVPGGLVVTADAYRAFLTAALAEAPSLLAAVHAAEAARPDVLAAACAELRAHLTRRPLGGEIARALDAALPPLLAGGPVAVRSSATLEDLGGAAFAGQHDTFLHVRTVDGVHDAVRRCFASLWTDRAVAYRRAAGFADDAAAMAVVVQTMVAADAAGVAFSIHPITGALDHVLMNSAWGLGETVVSGDGAIDQFVVDKGTLETIEAIVAEKAEALVGGDDGPVTVAVPHDRAAAPSLDDAGRRAVADLARRAERFYGFPQDIEWAIAGGRLHLLQSRPVTRLPERWTRDESAERFPDALTPLTWDFTDTGFHHSLACSLALMGLPPFDGRWFALKDGYVYGNQTAIRVFTAADQTAFGSLDELRALVPVFRDRYRWVQELPVRWLRDLDRYLLRLGALAAVDVDALDAAALWRHVCALQDLGDGYFEPNIALSITHGVLHRTLFRLLAQVVGPAEAPALYDALTGFCETKTNLVNAELHELADLARAAPDLAALLTNIDRRDLWTSGRLAAFDAFQRRFERFLADHGHREVTYDLAVPTWIDQPWVVLEQLRLMLGPAAPATAQTPAERERALRVRQLTAEARLLDAVPSDLHFFAVELLRLARAYTALDDLEHYQTTRLAVPMRRALLAVGRLLVGRGGADAPGDVFFARRATLAAWAEGDAVDVRAEIGANRAAWERQRTMPPPHAWGAAAATEMASPDGRGSALDGRTLRGLPGAPGVAEGPVFRVRSVDDFPRFPAGAVLVARTTNPAWTPLFYSAVAVIAESGGPLSHGAVTAREVGLPAVMAVRGALEVLSDGERVRVDGTGGVVERMDVGARAP